MTEQHVFATQILETSFFMQLTAVVMKTRKESRVTIYVYFSSLTDTRNGTNIINCVRKCLLWRI